MAREQDDGEHAAEKAAVKGHAALPELEALQRVCGEIARIVKQHVADAPAQDNAERHPQHEIVIIADGHGYRRGPELLTPDARAAREPAQEHVAYVGERLPAHGARR